MRVAGRWFCLLLVIAGLSGCGKEPALQERTNILLGTVVTVKAYRTDGANAYPLIDSAFREMHRIDSLCGYLETSVVSRINDNSGRSTPISKEVAELLAKSVRYSAVSGGALDVTVNPLSELWNKFENTAALPPSQASVDSVLTLVGYENLVVTDSSALLMIEGGSIDLGSLAKGYAVDRGIAILDSLGADGALIDAGGDIRTLGKRPDGTGWRIGLKDPRAPDSILTVFELHDKAIATSGDYERYFMRGDTRYHHILDPKTGFPARWCCSVTIIADQACDADAIATAVFVMGPSGMLLVNSLSDVEGLIVVCDDPTQTRLLRSPGIPKYENP
jgi:thiamine biosynthesis lipoprotein